MLQMIFPEGVARRSGKTALPPARDVARKVERHEIERLLAAELNALPPLAA